MGTFAALFCIGETEIQNKEEFTEKVEKVFQCGGMMDVEEVCLYGKRLMLISKAEMDSEGMDFYYNYFEDNSWENAGFSKKNCRVWSNKIGWSSFNRAVIAAYVLEEQYTKGTAIAIEDGDFVTEWCYVGWLNYLFNEFKHVKNYDTWKLFENYYYSGNKYPAWNDWEQWEDFGGSRYGLISSCEIYAVIYGTDKAYEKYENKGNDEIEDLIMIGLQIADAPAFLVKGIAEIFEKDFWELWKEIKDVVFRKREILYGNKGYYVVPISTEKFFHQNPDDMIPYWENDGKLKFSDELWEWFEHLKAEYNLLVADDIIIKHPLRYVLELMEEAYDDFYNVFTFADFFEESLENMSDKRYQALWRLYDTMIHDPELRKAADVIFVPEGPEHEKEEIYCWGEQPKRRLAGNWDFMDKDKKQNIGRITLRRYMALVGNRTLREKVFGF